MSELHLPPAFRPLGTSGIAVSPIAWGMWRLAEDGRSAADAARLVHAALDAGITFLDTADIYGFDGNGGFGDAEALLGQVLAAEPALRTRMVLATKGGILPPLPYDQSPDYLRKAIEDSLRRLQTDHIDLLWAHFWDRHTPVEEMMSAMDFLVKQGKVRYLGLSDHPAWVVTKCQYTALMRGWEPLCALQIEYSLLQRTVEGDLMTMARDLGLGVTPWSPLRGGVLSGKFDRDTPPPADGSTRVKKESNYLNERTYAIVDLLRAIAAERGCTAPQVALRWLLDQRGVTSVIIGARHLNQLHDNLGCCAVKLTEDDHRRLDEASKVERPFPWDFLDFVRAGIQNGTTINGVKSEAWHLTPKSDAERH